MRIFSLRIEKIFAGRPLTTAVFVTAGVFLLYAGTLVPEVGWGDSAELSLVAYELGLSHPPGYPLHAILGWGIVQFFTEPAVGTNLLSAICTSLAAGVMSLILFDLTARPIVAIIVPVLFGVLPNIWEMAVVTEIYNVNILFLGASIYLFLKAERSEFLRYLVPSAVLFGLSIGTYQANLLLFPVFLLVLLARTSKERVLGRLAVFCSIVGSFWLLFLAYTLIRSQADLTIQYPLNSFNEIIRYVNGADLRPSFPGEIAYYVERTIEHGGVFSKNFLYLPIPIGILGGAALIGRRKGAALFLLFLFIINYLFFSYYAVSDYTTMPTPSYFVFAILVGCGMHALSRSKSGRTRIIEGLVTAMFVLLIGMQIVAQFPGRFDRSNTVPVTDLIVPAMQEFPQDAIVINRWERYAPMLYFQKTRNLRNDLVLVVSHDYINQIDEFQKSLPYRWILIDNQERQLYEKYKARHFFRRWTLILPPGQE